VLGVVPGAGESDATTITVYAEERRIVADASEVQAVVRALTPSAIPSGG
jgi:hypothetical protein